MASLQVVDVKNEKAGSVDLDPSVFEVEVRAVNHRHLDARVRLPKPLASFEPDADVSSTGSCTSSMGEKSRCWQAGQLAELKDFIPIPEELR